MTFDLHAFRNTITNDFYSFEDFVFWPHIDSRLAVVSSPSMALQDWYEHGAETESLAQILLADHLVFDVLRTLLALPSEPISFADGREFPTKMPKDFTGAVKVSELLLDLGITRILGQGASLESLLLVAEIARDAKSRRTRIGQKLEIRIANTLSSVATAASSLLSMHVEISKGGRANHIPAARQLDYFVFVDSRPLLGIVIAFQTAQGGRQTRDLSIVYPQLQESLSAIPLDLVVIADGQGIRAASDKVLVSLAHSVGALITLNQAATGALLEEIVQSVQLGAKKTSTSGALSEMIEATLRTGNAAVATQLPVPEETARLAVARYAAQNPNFSLSLSPDSTRISWEREQEVKAAAAIVVDYNPSDALRLLAKLLQADIVIQSSVTSPHIEYGVIAIKEDAVIPARLTIAASSSAGDKVTLRQISKIALENTHESRFALLIVPSVPSSTELEDFRRTQKELSVGVVVLDPQILLSLTQFSALPRDTLVAQILDQSDLTKVSPFVLNSAVPQRMFYGREIEEATLLSTLRTNSVALLGGRRIGKTSLIHSVRQTLSDAGFATVFADCQAVRNWDEFGAVIERTWQVPAQRPFKPEFLLNSIDALAGRAKGKLVVLLDEIDQLLDWDQNHSGSEVPEALFRTFRTLSQEGVAQFLFSGERMIARKIWDPQSPHWNFCQPLMLRQLTKESAQRLIINPLLSMQINIEDIAAVSELAWEYTSGHPQILQFLGDSVVNALNEMPTSDRLTVSPDTISSIVRSFEYAEHYLSTYWGQSTTSERIISLLIAHGDTNLEAISRQFDLRGISIDSDILDQGLRMLELYGLIDKTEVGYGVRATYFNEMLTFYGGASAVLENMAKKQKECQ